LPKNQIQVSYKKQSNDIDISELLSPAKLTVAKIVYINEGHLKLNYKQVESIEK